MVSIACAMRFLRLALVTPLTASTATLMAALILLATLVRRFTR